MATYYLAGTISFITNTSIVDSTFIMNITGLKALALSLQATVNNINLQINALNNEYVTKLQWERLYKLREEEISQISSDIEYLDKRIISLGWEKMYDANGHLVTLADNSIFYVYKL